MSWLWIMSHSHKDVALWNGLLSWALLKEIWILECFSILWNILWGVVSQWKAWITVSMIITSKTLTLTMSHSLVNVRFLQEKLINLENERPQVGDLVLISSSPPLIIKYISEYRRVGQRMLILKNQKPSIQFQVYYPIWIKSQPEIGILRSHQLVSNWYYITHFKLVKWKCYSKMEFLKKCFQKNDGVICD